MAEALLEPTPKGALALHLPDPWGKGGATRWFETDMGVLLEAKPVAPVETTRTPRVRGLWPRAVERGLVNSGCRLPSYDASYDVFPLSDA